MYGMLCFFYLRAFCVLLILFTYSVLLTVLYFGHNGTEISEPQLQFWGEKFKEKAKRNYRYKRKQDNKRKITVRASSKVGNYGKIYLSFSEYVNSLQIPL